MLILGLAGTAAAQVDYGNRLGRRVGGRTVFAAAGPSMQIDALDPTIQRWYLPQELFQEYGRRQWSYTNYARERYLRYLEPNQEGSYFYDSYGNLITRGWLIYDWRQTQPLTFEAGEVTKETEYQDWFQRLLISTDASGDYSYSILIGDEINATLTPMTFHKPGFNGVLTSLETSRFQATGLFSRISGPKVVIAEGVPAKVLAANFTNLAAGRVEADVTDFLRLGLTLVNAHHANGNRDGLGENPFTGQLTSGQLARRLDLLLVRLGDDSPEDGQGGAVLFAQEVEITTTLVRQVAGADTVRTVARDTVIVGSDIGFGPVRQGGTMRDGFLSADGTERITLKYVLAPGEGEDEDGTLRFLLQQHLGLTLAEAEDALAQVSNVRFRLVLGSDYRVEVASDRQTNAVEQPQFLEVARAPGNIKNRLNQRQVVFDYGLPTAVQIQGLSAEIRDFHGFDFYGEFNINTRYRKYPAIQREKHRGIAGIAGDKRSVGWMANLAKRRGAWHFFAEAFGMDDGYSTNIRPVNSAGTVDYSPQAITRSYDLVDDNDDNDRHPDQQRIFQGSLIPLPGREVSDRSLGTADPEVFPGYDENHDFISDFNQNSNVDRRNFFPDYDEPFLRYHADRPEFLFGMDLNNNAWVDRFENDDLADYPYKKDHWGYNLYGRVQVNPRIRLTLGRLSQEQRQDNRDNRTNYGIFTFAKDDPVWGRLRVFDMVKRVEDTILDPLSQWIMPRQAFGQAGETAGTNQAVPDLLAGENTWINTFYADWDYASPELWSTRHRFKWETWRQQDTQVEFHQDAEGRIVLDEKGAPMVAFDPLGPDGRNGREHSGFVGLIDKVNYTYLWGRVSLSPRFKSEYLRATPFSRAQEKEGSWDALFFFFVQFPLLVNSDVQLGWEQRFFYELRAREKDLDPGLFTGDFRGQVLGLQLSNRSSYVGYAFTTQLGLRYDRRSLEVVEGDRDIRKSGLVFLSVFASLKE